MGTYHTRIETRTRNEMKYEYSRRLLCSYEYGRSQFTIRYILYWWRLRRVVIRAPHGGKLFLSQDLQTRFFSSA
eukprot:scaffold92912_cov23-Prasinocladus_malaysianus.AAC.1